MKTQELNKNFSTPEEYFKKQKEQVFLKAGLDFNVPDNYFAEQDGAKFIPSTANKSYRNWRYVGIAATLAIGLLMGLWLLNINNEDLHYNATQIEQANLVVAQVYLEEDAPIANLEMKDYYQNTPEINALNKEGKSVENQQEVKLSTQQIEEIKEEQTVDLIYDLYVEEEPTEDFSDMEYEWF